jgi:hypothetical protein
MSDVRQWLDQDYPGCLVADGHDEAIVGVLVRPHDDPVVVYDADRLIAGLVYDGDRTAGSCWTWEEAEEYADFNVFCAYFGPRSPLYVRFVTNPSGPAGAPQ